MPRIEDRRLLCLTAEQVATLVKACPTNRDKAVLLTFVDTGARLSEVIAMNWEDVDVASGVINIVRGKVEASLWGLKRAGHCLLIAGI